MKHRFQEYFSKKIMKFFSSLFLCLLLLKMLFHLMVLWRIFKIHYSELEVAIHRFVNSVFLWRMVYVKIINFHLSVNKKKKTFFVFASLINVYFFIGFNRFLVNEWKNNVENEFVIFVFFFIYFELREFFFQHR